MSTPETEPRPLPPAERLAVSRERLRQSMLATAGSRPKDEASSSGTANKLLETLGAIPGASIVIDAVRSWWSQNPMRVASLVAADAAKTMLRPMAQRNPLGLVLGAALVGGLIVWARPWRGILKPTLLAGLLPQLVSKAMAQVPIESWLAAWTSLTERERPPSPRPPPAASPPEARPEAPPQAPPAAPLEERGTAGQSTVH